MTFLLSNISHRKFYSRTHNIELTAFYGNGKDEFLFSLFYFCLLCNLIIQYVYSTELNQIFQINRYEVAENSQLFFHFRIDQRENV